MHPEPPEGAKTLAGGLLSGLPRRDELKRSRASTGYSRRVFGGLPEDPLLRPIDSDYYTVQPVEQEFN